MQIARAAATSARILIFDEPTAALTSRETERLFSFIRGFRAAGNSIFYISHRLDEILELSQRITVLRDGAAGRRTGPQDHRQGRDGAPDGRPPRRSPRRTVR